MELLDRGVGSRLDQAGSDRQHALSFADQVDQLGQLGPLVQVFFLRFFEADRLRQRTHVDLAIRR
jgi:hypothetical protein